MRDEHLDPDRIGVADVDAAGRHWLSFTGLGVGLIPVAFVLGVISLALLGPLVTLGVAVLVTMVTVVVARAGSPKRR